MITEQELEDWIDQRETQMAINSHVGYVRSEDVRLLMSKLRLERIGRQEIIDVLLATMSMSEGVTADAIIAAMSATAQEPTQ
jgi:hypothetical protein